MHVTLSGARALAWEGPGSRGSSPRRRGRADRLPLSDHRGHPTMVQGVSSLAVHGAGYPMRALYCWPSHGAHAGPLCNISRAQECALDTADISPYHFVLPPPISCLRVTALRSTNSWPRDITETLGFAQWHACCTCIGTPPLAWRRETRTSPASGPRAFGGADPIILLGSTMCLHVPGCRAEGEACVPGRSTVAPNSRCRWRLMRSIVYDSAPAASRQARRRGASHRLRHESTRASHVRTSACTQQRNGPSGLQGEAGRFIAI
jgi:hypothetical protein